MLIEPKDHTHPYLNLPENPKVRKRAERILEGGILLPDGTKVHKLQDELPDEADRDEYCLKHFNMPFEEVLKTRKHQLFNQYNTTFYKLCELECTGSISAEALTAVEKEFETCAKQGVLDAQVQLGLLYCIYRNVVSHWNESKGKSWLLKAARKGHYDAYSQLATFYLREEKYSEAKKYLMDGDKADCNRCQCLLGDMYAQGVLPGGLNVKKACKYYRLSARSENPEAACKLVKLAIEHNVLHEIKMSPVGFLKPYVDRGHLDAIELSARLYEAAGSAESDIDKSVEMWRHCAIKGSQTAQLQYGHILENTKGVYPVKQNPVEAIVWYLKAVKGDNPVAVKDAYYNLGRVHFYALNDREKSISFFTKAAEMGDKEARSLLTSLYAYNAFTGVNFNV